MQGSIFKANLTLYHKLNYKQFFLTIPPYMPF
jgi:hypothetical protein